MRRPLTKRLLKLPFYWALREKICLIPDKTEENQKKPVKTEEISLTKRSERLKVKCGTVLCTRMNTDDYGLSGR
jgi:hypothetical protein